MGFYLISGLFSNFSVRLFNVWSGTGKKGTTCPPFPHVRWKQWPGFIFFFGIIGFSGSSSRDETAGSVDFDRLVKVQDSLVKRHFWRRIVFSLFRCQVYWSD